MSQTRIILGLVALGLTSASCAVLPGRRDADELDEPVPREITLEVDNQNFHDATLYALRAGERRRIGNVVGLTRGQFAFVWTDNDLSVEIYLMALGSYYTRPMAIDPGDDVKLVVQPNLHKFRPGTVF